MLMFKPSTTRSWRAAIVGSIAAFGCARPDPVLDTPPQTVATEAPVVDRPAQVELASSVPARSPDVTISDLDRRTADLFGASLKMESALPVDSATVGGGDLATAPTWDIEVRSYETFDRVRFYVRHFS